jgi:hypothetical protein
MMRDEVTILQILKDLDKASKPIFGHAKPDNKLFGCMARLHRDRNGITCRRVAESGQPQRGGWGWGPKGLHAIQ